jgi:tRNA 2-(methylsulfanyl)-N6-isopentenyladenosine37 hydroxylase
MLHLKLPTDPRWASIAEEREAAILSDHAWCEQKAASTAISLIVKYYDRPEIVQEMTALAAEELSHFERVVSYIRKRGHSLEPERKDPYVNKLQGFIQKGGKPEGILVDRLLMAALIEARSCERFRLLSETLEDADLCTFYRELMASEAGHYTLFITLARNILPREQVDARWQEWLDFEAEILEDFSSGTGIHV